MRSTKDQSFTPAREQSRRPGGPAMASRTRSRHINGLLALVALLACLNGCQFIDMAKFSYANATATQQWAGAERTTTVPFKLVDNHIILPVRVNGSEPLNFVLDSGAGASVIIASRDSLRLQLQTQGELPVSGVGTGPDPIAGIVPHTVLTLGGVSLRGLSVIYLPLDAVPFFNDLDEVYFDGVIGAPFFAQFVVEIDYDLGLVTLSQPQRAQAGIENLGDGWREVPLHIDSGVPYMDARVDTGRGGSVPVKLLVDTGFRGAVSLTPASHAGLSEPTDYFESVSRGLSGDITNRVAMVDGLTLGNYRLPALPVSYAIAGGETEAGSNGLVGNEVLQQFNLVFDYGGKRLFLAPNQRFGAIIGADRSGLQIRPHVAGGIVWRIAPGSAARAGPLREGDIITSFAGQPVSYQSVAELKRVLASDRDSVHVCWLSGAIQHCDDLLLASRFGGQTPPPAR